MPLSGTPAEPAVRRATSASAVAGLAVFVACTLVAHVGASDLDPARHLISEYARPGSGVSAVMTCAFLAWALSLAATALLARRSVRGRGGTVLLAALAVAALGACAVAAFRTQAVAAVVPPNVTRTLEGRLHDLGGSALTAGLLLAAIAGVLLRRQHPQFTWSVGALVLSAVAVDVALLAAGDPVPGVRQRVLVAAGCLLQALLLTELRRWAPASP